MEEERERRWCTRLENITSNFWEPPKSSSHNLFAPPGAWSPFVNGIPMFPVLSPLSLCRLSDSRFTIRTVLISCFSRLWIKPWKHTIIESAIYIVVKMIALLISLTGKLVVLVLSVIIVQQRFFVQGWRRWWRWNVLRWKNCAICQIPILLAVLWNCVGN